LDGIVPGACAIDLVVKKIISPKNFCCTHTPRFSQRFDDQNIQSQKKEFKSKMG
jgi:hypothetical protein